MNLYVGNLSYSTTERDLTEAFEQYGEVTSARIITDRETGKNRGFAFVEMPKVGEAKAAMQALNGTKIGDNKLRVKKAEYRSENQD